MKEANDKIEFELDVFNVLRLIHSKKRFLIITVFVFVFLGVTISLITPKEFTSNTVFLPQNTGGGNGLSSQFGGLASLAGFSLNSMEQGSDFPPNLYPRLASSASFRLQLLNVELEVAGVEGKYTYAEYFDEYARPSIIKKYTIGLPELILSSLRGSITDEYNAQSSIISHDSSIIKLTKKEESHLKRLEQQLTVSVNSKDGYVQLSFTMPTAELSAQMARHAVVILQEKVIDFRIKNAKEELSFTKEQFEEKRNEFNAIQEKLAVFRDQNQNITSAVSMNELQMLESEYNLSFSIYSELAKQLEQVRLQVSKNTPVFSIIQPVVVPKTRSAPKRALMTIAFSFVGLILGVLYIFSRVFWNKFQKILLDKRVYEE